MDKNLLDKYDIKVNLNQASILLNLLEEHIDHTKITVGDALEIQMVQEQLGKVIEAERELESL